MQDNASFVEGTSFCLPLRTNVCFGFSLESLQVQLLTCRLFLKLPRRHRVVAPPSSLATFLPRKVIITAFCARKRRLDIPRSRRRRHGQNGSVVGWTFGHPHYHSLPRSHWHALYHPPQHKACHLCLLHRPLALLYIEVALVPLAEPTVPLDECVL